MTVIKRTIFFVAALLLFAGTSPLIAQQFGDNVKQEGEVQVQNTKKGFNPDVSVTLGSSFTSFGPGFNAFGTYVMPEITFPVSKKFAIRTGIGYSNMFYSTPGNTGSIFSQNNSQYAHIYVSGIYQVNEKLIISGTAYKTFDLAPRNNELNPRALDFSSEGIMFNVDYKVSDKFRINAAFSYQKQSPYDYYYNPGGFNQFGSPFGSPFGNPSFGPQNGF